MPRKSKGKKKFGGKSRRTSPPKHKGRNGIRKPKETTQLPFNRYTAEKLAVAIAEIAIQGNSETIPKLIERLESTNKTLLENALSADFSTITHDLNFERLPIPVDYNVLLVLIAVYYDGKTYVESVIDWILDKFDAQLNANLQSLDEKEQTELLFTPLWLALVTCLKDAKDKDKCTRMSNIIVKFIDRKSSLDELVIFKDASTDYAGAYLLELLSKESFAQSRHVMANRLVATQIKKNRLWELGLYVNKDTKVLAHEVLVDITSDNYFRKAITVKQLNYVLANGRHHVLYPVLSHIKDAQRIDMKYMVYLFLCADYKLLSFIAAVKPELFARPFKHGEMPFMLYQLIYAHRYDQEKSLALCEKVFADLDIEAEVVEADNVKGFIAQVINTLMVSCNFKADDTTVSKSDFFTKTHEVIPNRHLMIRIMKRLDGNYLNIPREGQEEDSKKYGNMYPMISCALSLDLQQIAEILLTHADLDPTMAIVDIQRPAEPSIPLYIKLFDTAYDQTLFKTMIHRDDFEPNVRAEGYPNMLHALMEYVTDLKRLHFMLGEFLLSHGHNIDCDELNPRTNETPLYSILKLTRSSRKDDVCVYGIVVYLLQNDVDVLRGNGKKSALELALSQGTNDISRAFAYMSIQSYLSGNKSPLQYILEHANSDMMEYIVTQLERIVLPIEDLSFVRRNKHDKARLLFEQKHMAVASDLGQHQNKSDEKTQDTILDRIVVELMSYIQRNNRRGIAKGLANLKDSKSSLQRGVFNHIHTEDRALLSPGCLPVQSKLLSTLPYHYAIGKTFLKPLLLQMFNVCRLELRHMAYYSMGTHVKPLNAPLWYILFLHFEEKEFASSRNNVRDLMLMCFDFGAKLTDVVVTGEDIHSPRSYYYEHAGHILFQMLFNEECERTKKMMLEPLVTKLINDKRYDELQLYRSDIANNVGPTLLKKLDEALDGQLLSDMNLPKAVINHDVDFVARYVKQRSITNDTATNYISVIFMIWKEIEIIALVKQTPEILDTYGIIDAHKYPLSYLLIGRADFDGHKLLKTIYLSRHDTDITKFKVDIQMMQVFAFHTLGALTTRTRTQRKLDDSNVSDKDWCDLESRIAERNILLKITHTLRACFLTVFYEDKCGPEKKPRVISLLRYYLKNKLDAAIQAFFHNPGYSPTLLIDTLDDSKGELLNVEVLKAGLDDVTFRKMISHPAFRPSTYLEGHPTFIHALFIYTTDYETLKRRLATLINTHKKTIDLNIPDIKNGKTPLRLALELPAADKASRTSRKAIIDLLLDNGARIQAIKFSPLDWALVNDIKQDNAGVLRHAVKLACDGDCESFLHMITYSDWAMQSETPCVKLISDILETSASLELSNAWQQAIRPVMWVTTPPQYHERDKKETPIARPLSKQQIDHKILLTAFSFICCNSQERKLKRNIDIRDADTKELLEKETVAKHRSHHYTGAKIL